VNAITYYFPEHARWIFGVLIFVGSVLAAIVLAGVLRDFLASEEDEEAPQ